MTVNDTAEQLDCIYSSAGRNIFVRLSVGRTDLLFTRVSNGKHGVTQKSILERVLHQTRWKRAAAVSVYFTKKIYKNPHRAEVFYHLKMKHLRIFFFLETVYAMIIIFLKQQIIIIRMISERSCDTEDWSNDAENSALHHRNKLHLKIFK